MSQKTAKRQRKEAIDKAASNGAPEAAKPVAKKAPLLVPYELADSILGYLGTRPYQEVASMIGGLMRCHPELRKE